MKKYSVKARLLASVLVLVLVAGIIQPSWVSASENESSVDVEEIEAEEADTDTETETDISADEPVQTEEDDTEQQPATDITYGDATVRTDETTDQAVIVKTEEKLESETEAELTEPVETVPETTTVETEAETEFETEFSYEDDTVTIQAAADKEAGLPVGTEYKVEALEKGSAEYEEAVAAVEAELNLNENQQLMFVPYDVYFMHDGERIEPEAGTVHVEMAFKDVIFDIPDDVMVDESFIAHIKNDGEVEQLENQTEADNAIVFDVSSFSVMGPAVITTREADSYTLTFDVNGGTMSEPSVVTKAAGEPIGELPVPTREGYTFNGWTDAKGPLGLKLKFNSQSHTESVNNDYLYIYYKGNDGELLRSDKYGGSNLSGCSISIPASEFWIYFHSDGSQNYYGFAFDSITSLDTAPSVSWSAADSLPSYSVIETMGDVYPESAHNYESNTNQLWHYTYVDMITESMVMPEKDFVCKAVWNPNTYEIIFDSNGGNDVKAVSGFCGSTIGVLPVPDHEKGYQFLGWYTEPEGGEKITESTLIPVGGATYYAHWNTYTLILDPNGGEGERVTVTLGPNENYRFSDKTFTRDGYILCAWNKSPDGTDMQYEMGVNKWGYPQSYWNIAGNAPSIIVYAQWTKDSDYATISFDSQGGSEVLPISFKKGARIWKGDLPDSIRDGYTFITWRIGSVNGSAVANSDSRYDYDKTEIKYDRTFYAEWKKNPTVTFDDGYSSALIQREMKYNDWIGTLPAVRMTAGNYQTFIGWFTEPSGGIQISDNSVRVTEDVTYYAHWSWMPKFNANGGHLIGSEEYPLQDDSNYLIEKLPEVTRDGHAFVGWYLPDGVTEVHDGDTIDLANGNEIIAHWEKHEIVTVTLDANGGNISYGVTKQTIKLYAGDKLTGLPYPYRNNYKFLGWADGDGNYYDESHIVNGDLSLKAQWTALDCTVAFEPGDGTMNTSSKTQKVSTGDTIRTLPGAKLSGYILDGWYTKTAGQGDKLTTDTIINSDVTYYAYYTPAVISNTDTKYHYIFGADWANASNEHVDNIADNLEFHPVKNSPQKASLHVRFELNKSIDDISLPTGSVQIRIPKYVWKDWDGNWIGTNNLSTQLAEYPEKRDGMFFSYIDNGDEYILVNNQDLAGGTGLDLLVGYVVDTPSSVPGGAADNDDNYVEGYDFYQNTVSVIATMDSDLDGNPETTDEKNLTLEMHTSLLPLLSKSSFQIYYTWKDEFGEKTADADDYFYVIWKIRAGNSYNNTQHGTMELSENTVHDGQVAGWLSYDKYSSVRKFKPTTPPSEFTALAPDSNVNNSRRDFYVLMKYPMELLNNIPKDGLVLENEVAMKTTWMSGYITYQRFSGSVVIQEEKNSAGSFKKSHNSSNNNYEPGYREISGGQENIVDDNRSVSMSWGLDYSGADHDIPVVWDEETKTYHAEPRTIVITDGVSGDLSYCSGEKNSVLTALPDEDYRITRLSFKLTEYDSYKTGSFWTSPTRHDGSADYEGVEIYVRYRDSNDFVYYKTVYPTYSNDVNINIPDGVAGYQIRHNTNFYATDLHVVCNVMLKPTEHVQALIRSDMNKGVVSLIRNRAVCDIRNTDDINQSAFFHVADSNNTDNYYELNMSTTSQYTKKYISYSNEVVLDVEHGTQDTPVCIIGYNHNDSGRLKKITSGEFYDLLPEGMTVDLSTVYMTRRPSNYHDTNNMADYYFSNRTNYEYIIDTNFYDIEFVPNWEGSRRTMMIIKFVIPEGIDAVGVECWYLLHNTYENIIENGTEMENDVAFINTTEGAVKPNYINWNQYAISEKYRHYYDSLQEQYAGFISYASESTHYVPVDTFSWGFEKGVKTDTKYESSAETIPNNEYTYRLCYSQSNDAVSSGIVFYDVLENGAWSENTEGQQEFLPSEWHGLLQSVDVSGISLKLTDGSDTICCNPVIYYSTKDRASFTAEDYNTANTATWSTERPTDASLITAVAVDCSKNTDGSDFVMKGRNVLNVYITMVAPKDKEFYDKMTYNNAVIYKKNGSDTVPTPEESYTKVTLRDKEPELHKTSNPETGTKDEPTRLYQNDALTYTLSVKNTDELFVLRDVIVEDTLPDKLTADTANIKVHFGDASKAVAVTASPRVALETSGQHLTFHISSLLVGETLYLVIPTTVTGTKGVLENTAEITSINDVEKELKSETTWHKITPETVSVSINKKVAGSMGDKTKDFNFRLKLSGNPIPESLDYTKGDVTGTLDVSADGVAEFTLAHGETIVFGEVPFGLTYEVIETDGESAGYIVESANASGTLEEDDVTVTFTNTKDGTVPTSADINTKVFLPFMLLAAAGMVWFFYHRRKTKPQR